MFALKIVALVFSSITLVVDTLGLLVGDEDTDFIFQINGVILALVIVTLSVGL